MTDPSAANGNAVREATLAALFAAAVGAAAPDDPTGHLPNCGYDLSFDCQCAAYGSRLRAALDAALPTAPAALALQHATEQAEREGP